MFIKCAGGTYKSVDKIFTYWHVKWETKLDAFTGLKLRTWSETENLSRSKKTTKDSQKWYEIKSTIIRSELIVSPLGCETYWYTNPRPAAIKSDPTWTQLNWIYILDQAQLQGQVTKNRGPMRTSTPNEHNKNCTKWKTHKSFLCFDCLILCLVTCWPIGWWISFLFNQSVFDTHGHRFAQRVPEILQLCTSAAVQISFPHRYSNMFVFFFAGACFNFSFRRRRQTHRWKRGRRVNER